MRELCIREFAYIIQDEQDNETNQLDLCSVNPEAWQYLEDYALSNAKEKRFIKSSSYKGKKAFQVVNFVGVITTPDGTHLEILPKTNVDGQDTKETRELLVKMLFEIDDLTYLETTDASLVLFDKPLPEILINRFLHKLADVVRKGIRKDYQRIEAEEKFLNGQLLVSQQINQPLGKLHLFRIAYDVFSEDRAENRLIHAALVQVARWCKSDKNQKLARELRFAFNDIPKSSDYKTDFSLWRDSRDMISYRALLPCVKLILNHQSPFAIKGDHAGISFLFPMESLFEKYVAKVLQKTATQNHAGYEVKSQIGSQYLSEDPKAFLLKPDLAIFKGSKVIGILDTKWKLIDQNATYLNGKDDPKSSISQSDMYQMFAYGHKYFEHAAGKLMLIYPKWKMFEDENKQFNLGNGLTLDVFPFDLTDPITSANRIIERFKSILEVAYEQ
jgi:5-methylcytosine-specific restriction enzyme subunit McrC